MCGKRRRNNMIEIPKYVTEKFLKNNPNVIFVFGDNTIRKGKGGAAKLRDEPNTYGFITKKYPNNNDRSFYRLQEYTSVFKLELSRLMIEIEANPDKTYLISKLGAGLANRYKIYEEIIQPNIGVLRDYDNVIIM
jgi:hypothetical protein